MTPASADLTTISLLFGIVMLLGFALLGRIGARKLGLPTVFGTLLTGILIGNLGHFLGYDLVVVLREGASCVDIARLALAGQPWDEAARLVLGDESGDRVIDLLRSRDGGLYLQVSQAADLFLRYGLIFIMFHIGLGTYVISHLRGIEANSFRVAVIGAVAPMALGLLMILVFAGDISHVAHLLIAATLGSTGMAVTASVLGQLRRSDTSEARIVLGAAVMDDVLGLVMLAIASGIAVTGSAALGDIGRTTIRTILFLVCAFGLGPAFLKMLVSMLRRLDVMEAKLFVSFVLVMFLAGLATVVQLSPIVGAFAAGLLMHESHFSARADGQRDGYTIRELFAPLEVIIVPVFFVLMGIQVKLETLLMPDTIAVLAALLAAAVIGKWLSGLGARGQVNRTAIGIGMLPRGEVGLAFAFIGRSLGVIDAAMFTVLVLVVVLTTLITPLLLRLVLGHGTRATTGRSP
jgi:Kef-type K+ transport system membrane component KefB